MRIAIVEDEAPIARRLERDVRSILAYRLDDLATLPTLDVALEYFRRHPVDLALLDLNLNGSDGFALLEQVSASRFHTIVVSAHDDRAIHAFAYGVTDFVPKPWTKSRLEQAVQRAVGSIEAERAVGHVGTHDDPAERIWLSVRSDRRIERIPLQSVVAIRGADDFAELYLRDGSRRLYAKTLIELERFLPSTFLRVHRSWIVRVEDIRSWTPAAGGRATLETEVTQVPVGHRYRTQLARRLRP